MPFLKHVLCVFIAVGFALALAISLSAQGVSVPVTPQVGSPNPVPPEPDLSRPSTNPCTVTLFANLAFGDFATLPISYVPPDGCAGPWAKVILTVDLTSTPNVRYERTATIFLGGANIFFGTTAVPRSNFKASWHVERDLTDYSVIFTKPETGNAALKNLTFATANAVIHGTATLLFYPADAANPAPTVPSQVLSLSGNTTYALDDLTNRYDASFTLPRNITRAYLDVISQGRDNNETWFACVPPADTLYFPECDYTAFRESDVYVDGVPAGVAPIFPWIYPQTPIRGDPDTYLWQPIVGIEALNFKPYRVNLTPFAAILSDGNQHSVDISIFQADHGFTGASNLLLYTDPSTAVVTGALNQDTLTYYPSPSIQDPLGRDASGSISVQNFRAWQISGYVVSSSGRTDTTITATNSFKNLQTLGNGHRDISQETDQQETTTVVSPSGTTQSVHSISYPLIFNSTDTLIDPNQGGGNSSGTYVRQQKKEELIPVQGFTMTQPSVLTEAVESDAFVNFDAIGGVRSVTPIHSESTYGSKDSNLNCVVRTLTSQDLKLTHYTQNTDCSGVQF